MVASTGHNRTWSVRLHSRYRMDLLSRHSSARCRRCLARPCRRPTTTPLAPSPSPWSVARTAVARPKCRCRDAGTRRSLGDVPRRANVPNESSSPIVPEAFAVRSVAVRGLPSCSRRHRPAYGSSRRPGKDPRPRSQVPRRPHARLRGLTSRAQLPPANGDTIRYRVVRNTDAERNSVTTIKVRPSYLP